MLGVASGNREATRKATMDKQTIGATGSNRGEILKLLPCSGALDGSYDNTGAMPLGAATVDNAAYFVAAPRFAAEARIDRPEGACRVLLGGKFLS